MKIVITLDNIDEAIEKLQTLKTKITDFPEVLANDVQRDISMHYHMTVSADHMGNTTIMAEREGIAFIEYGAGFIADDTMIGNIVSYPGAWSIDHAQTMFNWKGSEADYPFNRYPNHYMEGLVVKLETQTETKAREYFND